LTVFAVNLAHSFEKKHFEYLLGFVDENKRTRIESFIHERDKRRCLVGDILVRYVLSVHLNMCPTQINFDYNSYGKPHVKRSPIYFSLSHSGDWVTAALDNQENGIDIQKVGKVDLNVAERFYLKSEYRELLEKDERERTDLFYEWWTLKECYIKTTGKGLFVPLDSFIIEKSSSGGYTSYIDSKKLYFRMYDIDPLYKMALSSFNKNFADEVCVFTTEELYCLFKNSVQDSPKKYVTL
jgi:4'-phosphopantetheinyl transferase